MIESGRLDPRPMLTHRFPLAKIAEAFALAEGYRDRLPKADIGKSCVRFQRLDDLDQEALRELVREAAKSPAASAR